MLSQTRSIETRLRGHNRAEILHILLYELPSIFLAAGPGVFIQTQRPILTKKSIVLGNAGASCRYYSYSIRYLKLWLKMLWTKLL